MDPFLPKNLRSEPKLALKQANKAWTDCIAQHFLPDWLNGKNLNINEVCTDELQKLSELDQEQYGALPFRAVKTD